MGINQEMPVNRTKLANGTTCVCECEDFMPVEAFVRTNQDYEDGFTELMQASQSGDLDRVLSLIAEGYDVRSKDALGMNALMCCAMGEGTREIARVLMETVRLLYGRDALTDFVNEQDNLGMTTLMHAASSGNREVAEEALLNGAKVNIRSEQLGVTALICSSKFELSIGVADLLLDVPELDVNMWENSLSTALIVSIAVMNFEFATLLLSKRGKEVHVNLQDINKKTALMRASQYGEVSLIDMLQEYGADRTLKDIDNMAAIDYAPNEFTRTRLGEGWNLRRYSAAA